MEFNVKSGNPEKQRTACLIIGVSQPRKLSRAGRLIDKISDGYLSTIIRRGDMDGKLGQTLALHNVPGTLADRVLLVGCGKDKNLNEHSYSKIIKSLSSALENLGAMEAYSYLTDVNIKGRDVEWKIRHTVMQMEHNRYNFDQLKSDKKEPVKGLRKLVMNVPSRRELSIGESAILQGQAISPKETRLTSVALALPLSVRALIERLASAHSTCEEAAGELRRLLRGTPTVTRWRRLAMLATMS